MNNRASLAARLVRVQKLKEEIALKSRLLKEKRALAQQERGFLSNLMENEMEQAAIVLAAKNVLEELQDMAEKLAKMSVEDIMPLVDQIKSKFGPEMAGAFENAAKQSLDAAKDSVISAKDMLGGEVSKMEGTVTGEPVDDMSTGGQDAGNGEMNNDMASGDDPFADASTDGEENEDPNAVDDLFSDNDTVAPLGRDNKADLAESKKGKAKKGSAVNFKNGAGRTVAGSTSAKLTETTLASLEKQYETLRGRLGMTKEKRVARGGPKVQSELEVRIQGKMDRLSRAITQKKAESSAIEEDLASGVLQTAITDKMNDKDSPPPPAGMTNNDDNKILSPGDQIAQQKAEDALSPILDKMTSFDLSNLQKTLGTFTESKFK